MSQSDIAFDQYVASGECYETTDDDDDEDLEITPSYMYELKRKGIDISWWEEAKVKSAALDDDDDGGGGELSDAHFEQNNDKAVLRKELVKKASPTRAGPAR